MRRVLAWHGAHCAEAAASATAMLPDVHVVEKPALEALGLFATEPAALGLDGYASSSEEEEPEGGEAAWVCVCQCLFPAQQQHLRSNQRQRQATVKRISCIHV